MWDFPMFTTNDPTTVTLEGLFMECQNSKMKRILYILLFFCVQEKNPEETCILGEVQVWTQHEQKSSLIWNSKRQKLLRCNFYITSQSG